MPSMKQFRLPNGQNVFYRSKLDLDILSRELLTNDHLYLRNGISLNEGDCVFDVGANIGFFLLSLNRILKHGKVFAFEPISEIFEVLERNAEAHNHLDVKLFPCGLSKSIGSATFTYFPRTSVASTMYPDSSDDFRRNSRRFVLEEIGARSSILRFLTAVTPAWLWYPITELVRRHYHATKEVTCQLRTLSDVINDLEIEWIDLLKVDTEGAEEDVLAGLEPWHWARIKQAVIEVHQGPASLKRMEQLLQQKGFDTSSEPVLPGVDHLHVVFARRKVPVFEPPTHETSTEVGS